MIDLKALSTKELLSLNRSLDFELFIRIWWIVPAILIVVLGVYLILHKLEGK